MKGQMEKHVTNLEISKRLKELGMKQDSNFYWCFSSFSKPERQIIYYENKLQLEKDFVSNRYDLTSAFLASELEELLPDDLNVNEKGFVGYCYLEITKTKYDWACAYEGQKLGTFAAKTSETLTGAMGKMLIHLLENNLITL